jgi:hypothetical protein
MASWASIAAAASPVRVSQMVACRRSRSAPRAVVGREVGLGAEHGEKLRPGRALFVEGGQRVEGREVVRLRREGLLVPGVREVEVAEVLAREVRDGHQHVALQLGVDALRRALAEHR